jgi:hypothetical protein
MQDAQGAKARGNGRFAGERSLRVSGRGMGRVKSVFSLV